MGVLSEAQHWAIELIGTIIFLLGAGLFAYGLLGEFSQPWYIYVVALVVGLYMMGYKAIPDKLSGLLRK